MSDRVIAAVRGPGDAGTRRGAAGPRGRATRPATLAGFDLGATRRALPAGTGSPGLRPIGLREVHLGPDALDSLPAAVAGCRRPGDVVVLVDRTPMRRGEDDLKRLVADTLAPLGHVRTAVIGADREELHADEAALAEADRAIAGAGVVVSVGSGTITDIAKDATHRAGGIPFVVVQTAISVNAFSDDMAVLLRNGVKRTVPSRWPDVLVVDLPTLADAPRDMNQAGFGELISMFTAPADWYLATAVGLDDSYDARVVATFRRRGSSFLDAARGVLAGDHAALAELASLMTLSGIAMGVTGRTAPFSGMEHTVSHLLDMTAAGRGGHAAFHGAQVGVAAALAAILWRRVLEGLDPERLLADAATPSPEVMQRRIRDAFERLDPTGAVAAECWRDYSAKLARWTANRDRVRALVRDWDTHRATLCDLTEHAGTILSALRRAGAPTRFGDLDPAPGEETVRWALLNCHLMRDRFTVADLATFGGLWDESMVDVTLAEAAVLGGGL